MRSRDENIWQPPRSTASHFYRYGGAEHLEWLERVITNDTIYLPTFAELNDPRDGKPRLADVPADRIVDFLYRKYEERTPAATPAKRAEALNEIKVMAAFYGREWLLREMTRLLHELFDQTRVYCMSQRWNNLPMWAKYADGHQGYCVEFANVPPFAAARMVVYDNSPEMDVTNEDHAHFGWFYLKTTEWSNEEEVRLVLPRLARTDSIAFPPQALNRIILGERMSMKNRKVIASWVQQRTVPLSVCVTQFDRYRQALTLIPI